MSERPFKEAITFENRVTLQRSFTTQSKRYRIRRGHTIIIRRSNEIMKHLHQMGFKNCAIVRKESVESAIFYCAGGDYRTIRRYLGYNRLVRKGNAFEPPVYVWRKGYLERLRYVERDKNSKYRLNHYLVPLSYHYRESLVPPSSSPSPNCREVHTQHGKNVCVQRSDRDSGLEHVGLEAIASIQRNKTNKHNTHTNRLTESIPEPATERERILRSTSKDGG